jgi:hypothetical protein
VDSPKTGVRWVPLFPELRRYFTEAFELAEPGAVRVIARYRDANSNLRTQLMRIIRRAGFEPWPNLFHNLRASRETELTADFPIHVVCEWIGNSALIAQKHYLQVMEEDFQRAAKSGAILTETALRKGVPQLAALTGTDSQALKKKPGKTRLFCRLLRRDARWRNTQVYPQGGRTTPLKYRKNVNCAGGQRTTQRILRARVPSTWPGSSMPGHLCPTKPSTPFWNLLNRPKETP